MDPEKITPETTPLGIEPTEEKKLFQAPEAVSDSLSTPVSATPSVNMWSINVDPKLLASYLEDTRSEEKVESGTLFHQPLQAKQETADVPVSKPQVVEKIVYQKQRIHGFFRTLTLLTLLFVGVLMLLEVLGIFSLSIGGVAINTFYPVFVILSVIVIWSYKGIFGKIFGFLMFLSVVAGFFVLSVYSSLTPSTTINPISTWSNAVFPLESWHRYSKVYIQTVIDALQIVWESGANLLSTQYDTDRKMILLSGTIQSGHTYAIVQESPNVNLLERVYTKLHVWLNTTQPLYIYIKTLFGQNNLDFSETNVRDLRIHGGIISQDIILWTGFASGAKIDLEAAVADVTLHIPKTIAIRLYHKSYIGKNDLPDFRQTTSENMYVSNNIDKATSVLDINALFGLSKFTIVRDR